MTTPTQRSQSALGMTLVGALAIVAVVALIAMRQPSSPAGSAVQTDPPASAAVAAVASSAAEAPAIVQVLAAEDPLSAAWKVLFEEYGLTCASTSQVMFQPNPKALAAHDTTIADQKLDSGWVVNGRVYKGGAADAARAFGAKNAFARDESVSVWIVVPGDVPMAVELRALETPAKNVVWVSLNTIRPCIDHD